jgi:hypothetical protein
VAVFNIKQFNIFGLNFGPVLTFKCYIRYACLRCVAN